MNKKLWILGLALMLASAAYAQQATNFSVELNADSTGIIITKYTGNAVNVIVPTTLEGLPVTGIGKGAFKDNMTINKVSIYKGVTEIRDEAFQGCRNLNSITLPDTLKKIGERAFDSTGLLSISIPGGCNELGEAAFSNASRLTSIVFPANFTAIPANAFLNCTALATVGLPAAIKTIGSKAFGGCTALTTFNVNSSVSAITFAQDVFAGCTKLNLGAQVAIKKLGYTGTF